MKIKCLFFTVFLSLILGGAHSQQTKVSTSQPYKSFGFRESRTFHLFGADKDNVYGILYNNTEYTKINVTAPVTIYKMPMDGGIVQKKVLKDLGKKCIISKAFVNENTIDLLIIKDFDGDLLHVCLDKKTLERKQEDKKIGYYKGVSPEETWVAISNPNGDGTSTTNLYSSDFELIWSKNVSFSDIIDVMVTEDAEVILLGTSEKSGKEGFYFHIISEDNEEQFFVQMETDGIRNIRLANYKNGCIYAGGLTFHWSDEKNPKDRAVLYDGYYSMMFNTRTQESVIDKETFKKKDIDAIFNTRSGKDAEYEATLGHLPYAGKISTPNVTALAFHYVPTVIYDGIFLHGGILFFGIGDDGKLAWKHVIRRWDKTSNEQYVNQDFFEYNGKACVVYEDNRYNGNEMNELEPVKVFRSAILPPALYMVSVSKDGEAVKETLEKNSNKCLIAPSVQNIDNGNRHFLIHMGSKSEIVTLENNTAK